MEQLGDWAQEPNSVLFICCVTLGEKLNLSELYFPPM